MTLPVGPIGLIGRFLASQRTMSEEPGEPDRDSNAPATQSPTSLVPEYQSATPAMSSLHSGLNILTQNGGVTQEDLATLQQIYNGRYQPSGQGNVFDSIYNALNQTTGSPQQREREFQQLRGIISNFIREHQAHQTSSSGDSNTFLSSA